MNSATDNEMCAICRKIRPDKYNACKGICKALTVFLGLTEEEAKVYRGPSPETGQTSQN